MGDHRNCQRSTPGQGPEGVDGCCFPPLPRENCELQCFLLPLALFLSKETSILENACLYRHGILRFTLPDDLTECQLE